MGQQGREMLFEIVRVGDAIKVTAIDPGSGVEASIVASPRYSAEHLKLLAGRKLENKLRGQSDSGDKTLPPRRGILA